MEYIRSIITYDPGFSGNITPIGGATGMRAWLQGAGGAGHHRADVPGSGGGGGAYCYFETIIIDTEGDNEIAISVGNVAEFAAGGNTTISGILNGTSFNVNAGGGYPGTTGADGTGGIASGGTENINGNDASGFVAAPVDERAQGFGGLGACKYRSLPQGDGFLGYADIPVANMGAGGNGILDADDPSLANGEPGALFIEWLF